MTEHHRVLGDADNVDQMVAGAVQDDHHGNDYTIVETAWPATRMTGQ